jgi:hypothetical protein
MRLHIGFDGFGSSPQCLSDDVAAIQATPRVLPSGTDKCVNAVGFKGEKLLNGHVFRL